MKNILLAVTGLSPQVITETLYALRQNRQHIDEIHIITTRSGKEQIYSQLIGGTTGHFYRYLEEYEIEKNTLRFGHDHVHVVTDEHGNEISDIVTAFDNERLLRKCLDLAFHFTGKADTAVYFSVAGGRKTMSSCLTLAAQLYGRPRDRLYHVLVSPEFESNRDFFYPPRTSRKIELKDEQGQPVFKETKYAQINLINIAFVSIREHLSPDHLTAPNDPGTLMLSLIRDEESGLTINLNHRKIIYKTLELDMMPSHMALYAFFAAMKKDCDKTDAACRDCKDCFVDITAIMNHQEEISKLYRKMCGNRPTEEMSDSGIMGLTPENCRSIKSKLNKMIADTFGATAAKELEISSTGTRPDTRYGIMMDKSRMEIVI